MSEEKKTTRKRKSVNSKGAKMPAVTKPRAKSTGVKRTRQVTKPKKELRRIAVVCTPGLDGHLGEIVDHFKSKYEVKVCVTSNLDHIFEAIKWADTIWIEWANKMAVDVTAYGHLLYQKQIILRLHSYEAFIPELEFINWAYITDLIFVADHIREMVMGRFPTIAQNVDRVHTIPNGIDTERFAMVRDKAGPAKRIAYLGSMNFKKGTQLMFNAFAELVRSDPEFQLHIGGEYQDPRYPLYLAQMIEQGIFKPGQVRYHGRIEDVPKWLGSMSHIMCSSLLESQCKAVMEGMSMGLKPLVHNFVGAKDIYPKGVVWSSIYQFVNQAMNPTYKPIVYRDHIVRNYNTVDQIAMIDVVLNAKPDKVEIFKSDKPDPVKLSVVMIMRDGQEHLARCLDSVKDIADEIVIVDTGSVDDSIEIAEQYGAKVYHHEWENDFSLHRNQSIGYATGDWMLIMDCDNEIVGDLDGLKSTLGRLSDNYNSVSFNKVDAGEDKGNEVNSTRALRRGFVKYRRAWHNMPIVEGMEKYGAVFFKDASIVHYGGVVHLDEEGAKQKTLRSKVLLEKSLQQDPDDYELFYYMLQVYGLEEKWHAAVNVGEKYIAARHKVGGFQYAAYYSLIRLYTKQIKGGIGRALSLLAEAKMLLPNDLDIAFIECELGMVTGNPQMMLSGARRYVSLYDIFKANPDAKGGRFTFHLNATSLLFCWKHMTGYLLKDGIDCLKKLQLSLTEFPEGQSRIDAEQEIAEMLKPMNIDTQ